LLWLALTRAGLGLGAVSFALLLGALQVAALLSEVVAIGLTLQTIEQGGRPLAMEAAG